MGLPHPPEAGGGGGEKLGGFNATGRPTGRVALKRQISISMQGSFTNQNIVSILPAFCTKGHNHASDDFACYPDHEYLLP